MENDGQRVQSPRIWRNQLLAGSFFEEEASETNACVDVRSGLLNPPFECNKSHTTSIEQKINS